MRRTLLFALVVLVIIPVAGFAVPNKPMTFQATKSQAQNEKVIKKGIEGAVSGMSFITRPIARSKLTKSNIAFKSIGIKIKGKTVSIQHDSRKTVDSPQDGSAVQWTREDGETFTVTQKVSDKNIVQVFKSADGKKTLKYDFNDDFSSMKVHVVLESSKLSGPVKYSLDYAQK